MALSFDFGHNWQAFSEAKVDASRLHQAADSMETLLGAGFIRNRSVLDVGCGSGLFSLAASRCGASAVVGFDVNPTAVEVSTANAKRLASELGSDFAGEFRTGSILDKEFLSRLGTFDIVYAWGSLHHTGQMWQAICNATTLVSPGGTLVLALYNRHWTAPLWKQIKRLYNLSPAPGRSLLNHFFGAVIYGGVWVTTRQNPLKKERGMDFWYDVIDWLGGYPYEYASPKEVKERLEDRGFRLDSLVPPRGNTGCNQFVFNRIS